MSRVPALWQRTIRALPAGLRRLCAAIVVVLVACPVAISALRATEFRASIEVFVLDQPPELPVRERSTSYVGSLVGSKVFEEFVRRAGFALDSERVSERVTIEPTERSVLVTAAASTPEDAVELASALTGALASASRALLGRRAKAELATLRPRLEGELDVSERTALSRRVAALEPLAAAPPPQVAFGPPPERPAVRSLIDRAVDRLPGPLPANPGPLRAGGAGLLLAALACMLALLLWRVRDPRRSGRHPGDPKPAAFVSGAAVALEPRGARPGGTPLALPPGALPQATEPARALPTASPGTAPPHAESAAPGVARLALVALAGAVAFLFWRHRGD